MDPILKVESKELADPLDGGEVREVILETLWCLVSFVTSYRFLIN